jgi:ABC-2 type transport system permease protein
MLFDFLRAAWLIGRKDLRVWLRRPTTIAVTVVPPLLFLLVQALGAAAVGRSPVALVVHEADAAGAQALLKNLDVVAVITIPPDFTQHFLAHESAPIDVTVNNLNLDFTSDIRRAVPDAITQYYLAQGDASPIKVTMHETDLRVQDVELFQYAVLPTIVLMLTINSLITGGLATAGEWERRTIKELLLSPAPGAAIIAGKVLAGFIITFVLGALVFIMASLIGWVHPAGVYWLVTLLIVALVALFGSGLGVAVGALMQRVQPVIAISINAALYLFFLSGGISVLAFEPAWLQDIAAFIPLTYGNHALQMAVFYNSPDLLGRDVAVLLFTSLLTIALGALAIRRQIAR